uniref:Uncharacterized protein n=1 Tax=Fagus sylvatica TaxID=28930 RepID=A0A2N9GJ94_FAGSY
MLRSLSHGYETLTLRSNHSAKSIKSCAPRHDLQGQSVAIIGLGTSGRAAARLALARGASVLAIDQNKNLGLLEQDPLFEKHSGLRTILGHLDVQLLKDVDVVVVSPGVPLENYGLSSLMESGKRIMSELDFAAEILPKDIKILAVTGTNGKSTVVTFAGQQKKLEAICWLEVQFLCCHLPESPYALPLVLVTEELLQPEKNLQLHASSQPSLSAGLDFLYPHDLYHDQS